MNLLDRPEAAGLLVRPPSRPKQRLVAVVLGVAAVGIVAGGCSGGTTGSKRDGAALELVNTTPKGAGAVEDVTWALPDGEPPTIDPAKSGSESSNTVVTNLCDSLLRLEPDWSISSALATSAEWTDDTTFVIALRDDATFWDGSKVTADDVVFSLQRQMDPKTQAVNASVFDNVDTIKETGPLEVTISFTAHDSVFRDAMASIAGDIMQRAFTEKTGDQVGTPSGGLMCSGAYSLVSWTSGKDIKITANDAWWGGKPKVQNLTFEFISDDATLTSALAAGEIDGSFGLPPGSVAGLRKSGSGSVFAGPSSSSISMSPTTSDGPAADPKIRAALDLAIDKKAFVKNQLRGAGEVQKTLTPELVWSGDDAAATYRAGYDALPDTDRDLAAAKKLLATTTVPDKTLTIAVSAGDQLTLQAATLAQAAGKELGIELRIKQLQATEFSELFYDAAKRESVDFVVTTGYIEYPGALVYASLFALPDTIFNWSGYSDDEVTTKLQEARAATDPQAAAAAFVDAQKVFAPARLQISFANAYSLLFMNKRITGAPASFSYISTPWAADLGGTK
ncbi:ABC transporter substrate-binding protein [Aeromicrobium endophyticum]|uniref:ABC transporter substrate-binding protein n=1 Tax=Aeromicrobium endophyticum TaxID=2292704 RepID=UPI0013148C99|nr:ABC transporter substrate-binding protein [Aeromicrobium endophyticum]